jgi:hypothetical protein
LFRGWVQDGVIISTDVTLTFVASASVNIYAEFIPIPEPVEISVAVNDDTFGTVIGTGSYTEGDDVMLIATPASGYEFVSWVQDGKTLSNLSTLYFTATESCTIEATFRYIEKTGIDQYEHYSCSIYPNPVSSMLYIQSEEEIEMVKLTSLSGAVVYQSEVFDHSHQIDVTAYKQGVYVLVVKSNGESFTQTVLIQ